MPWCENDGCEKRGLKSSEVVFDEENKRVLCVPCGQQASETNDALKAEVAPKTWFGVGYSSDVGIKAEVVYGGARLSVNVNNDEIMRLFGQ